MPVRPPPSVTRSRTVPLLAVQMAATSAVIAPLALAMLVRVMPVAVPPETTETVSVEADVSLSETVAMLARNLLGFETLETRRSDSLDFREVAVWNVREALERAYQAGRAAR